MIDWRRGFNTQGNNYTFDIGLLYSENLSLAVYVAFDSENSFDNFEETFGTNFIPKFNKIFTGN
jgi:hypothetical protein